MSKDVQIAMALIFAVCDFSIYIMAQLFAADITAGRLPITAETYGEAVYEIPAVFWISVQSNSSMMGIIGCLIAAASRKYHRIGWFMALIGNTLCIALFGLFGTLAEESLLRAVCFGPGLMIGGMCAVLSGRCFFYGDRNE